MNRIWKFAMCGLKNQGNKTMDYAKYIKKIVNKC